MKNSFNAKLIVSEEKNPSVRLQAGQKFEVATIQLIDTKQKPIKAIAARLCGGTSTCLALIDVSDEVEN